MSFRAWRDLDTHQLHQDLVKHFWVVLSEKAKSLEHGLPECWEIPDGDFGLGSTDRGHSKVIKPSGRYWKYSKEIKYQAPYAERQGKQKKEIFTKIKTQQAQKIVFTLCLPELINKQCPMDKMLRR